MALRKEKLQSFKRDLLTRRQSLAQELTQATADFINDEPNFADAVDQAAADTDKTITLHIKNRDRNILWEIDEALRRIEAGTFGECERCGESITEARMKARPSTTLCIDCKAELESEQNRFPGRQ
jgi:DnaK suppressor protein